MRQRKYFARDLFHLNRFLRVQAPGRGFRLDHRNGGGDCEFFENFIHHHPRSQWRTGKLGITGKTVAIHMCHQTASAGRGGDIRGGHIGQIQRAFEKLKRIDNPAAVILRVQLKDGIGIQNIAPPMA